jgi:hypothetical protein
MDKQPDMDEVVKQLKEYKLDDSQISYVLSSIIKQQLMYGGSLADKVNFCLYEARKNMSKL